VQRYIALAWDTGDIGAQQFAKVAAARVLSLVESWARVHDQPGLIVCRSVESPEESLGALPLCEDAGIVIGTVFKHEGLDEEISSRVKNFSSAATRRLVQTGARSSVSSYWGSYVMLLRDAARNRTFVLCSPMSRLPCFHTMKDHVHFFFSRVDDCASLGLLSFTIAWNRIRAQATGGDYLSEQTSLNEVRSVMPGECVEISGDSVVTRVYWNPSTLMDPCEVGSVQEAAAILRKATKLCINSWASLHDVVLLMLSGGVDSSIVLSCLASAPTTPKAISVNFYSRGSADERIFARSMTDKLSAPLVEQELNPNLDLRVFRKCARTASPVLNYSAFEIEPALIRMAREFSATAVFSGEGGDDIFGRSFGPEILADVAMRHGIGPAFVSAAIDYGQIKRTSVWRSMAQGFKCRQLFRAATHWSVYRYVKFRGDTRDSLLASDAVIDDYEQHLEEFIHPWFRQATNVPPGRFQLIDTLIMTTSTWSHPAFSYDAGSLFLTPLASQPLVDSVMRIPARLHISGAQLGAVVRTAFTHDLSELVRQRGTGKGTPVLWIKDVMERNNQFLKEFLLDGILVAEGVLDRQKVERALAGVSRSRVSISEIIAKLYIESWVRQWNSVEGARVAA
jgi:asparagine synthase (glutamine-hydrolysing)